MDREVDATSVEVVEEERERAIDGGQLDGRDSRRPRSAHLHPTNRRWALRSATHGNALQTAPRAAPSWHLSPPPLPSSHHDLRTARGRAWRRWSHVSLQVGPRRARVDGALPKGVQPQPRHEELCLNAQGVRACPGSDRRFAARTVWVRRRRRADDARAAHRGLGSGFSLNLFLEGACRCLIGCLHHRRAHGPLVPASDHARRAR